MFGRHPASVEKKDIEVASNRATNLKIIFDKIPMLMSCLWLRTTRLRYASKQARKM